MKDSNLRFPRSKQGGIAASPMRDKMVRGKGFEPFPSGWKPEMLIR